jgi:hypothetical protein
MLSGLFYEHFYDLKLMTRDRKYSRLYFKHYYDGN